MYGTPQLGTATNRSLDMFWQNRVSLTTRGASLGKLWMNGHDFGQQLN